MSFSANVKNEILSSEIENTCCIHSFAYGMMLFSRAFSYYDMYLLTEHEGVAEKYSELMQTVCGVTPKLIKSDAGKFKVEVQKRKRDLRFFRLSDMIKKQVHPDLIGVIWLMNAVR